MMRVTHRSIADNMSKYMAESLEKLNYFQNQLASEKKFTNASDNPSLATSALAMRLSLQANESYQATAETTSEWMGVNEVALGQMIDIAGTANDLVLKGMSDTQNADERAAFAIEIDELIRQGLDVANTNLSGNYIFSGFKTSTKPFSLTAGSPDTINYAGDAGVMQRSVGVGQKITVNFDSESTFRPLFDAMIRARDALNVEDEVELQAGLQDLTDAMKTLNQVRTTNAGRQKQLDATLERLEGTQVEIEKLLSIRQDVDMAEAIVYLRNQETVYQAVLEVSQRAISTSNLFQYLK